MTRARYAVQDLSLPLVLVRLIARYMDWPRIWNSLVRHGEKHHERDQTNYLLEKYDKFCTAYYEQTYSNGVRAIVSILGTIRRDRGYLMYAPVTHAEVKAWLEPSSGHVLQRWEAWLYKADGTPHGATYTCESSPEVFDAKAIAVQTGDGLRQVLDEQT